MSDQARGIIAALGGKGNIRELESCITRLRIVLADPALVDEPGLKRQGAIAVVRMGTVVQVILGTQAQQVESSIKRELA